MKENIEFGNFLNPEEKKSAHIEYCCEDGLHQIILRKNLDSLIYKIKKGEVSEINLETLTDEEIDKIGSELAETNFSVISGESDTERWSGKVLKIEKKTEEGF